MMSRNDTRGTTLKGARTRAGLEHAAREIFERDGFADAKITEITERAGVAAGTFYSYFSSKEQIFRAVSLRVMTSMTPPAPPGADHDALARIYEGNRVYLHNYRANARFLVVLQHTTTRNVELATFWQEHRHAFIRRAAQAIERLQRLGQADDRLDAQLAATALSGMVQVFAYNQYGLGDEVADEETSARTLTLLWANAIGLDVPHDWEPPEPSAH